MTRILLIDDESRRAQALLAYFEEICGWRPVLANGVDSALEILNTSRHGDFDLVILDIMMDPGKAIPLALSNQGMDTGLILLDQLRRTIPNVPIIVYTARIDLDYLSEDSRVAAYIQKPRTARELSEVIRKVLDLNKRVR